MLSIQIVQSHNQVIVRLFTRPTTIFDVKMRRYLDPKRFYKVGNYANPVAKARAYILVFVCGRTCNVQAKGSFEKTLPEDFEVGSEPNCTRSVFVEGWGESEVVDRGEEAEHQREICMAVLV